MLRDMIEDLPGGAVTSVSCGAADAATLRRVVDYCDAAAVELAHGDALLRTFSVLTLDSTMRVADLLACTPLLEAACLGVQHIVAGRFADWKAQMMLFGDIVDGAGPRSRRQRSLFRNALPGLMVVVERDDCRPTVIQRLPSWSSDAWRRMAAVLEPTLVRMETQRLARRGRMIGGHTVVLGLPMVLHIHDTRAGASAPATSRVDYTANGASDAAYIGGGRMAYVGDVRDVRSGVKVGGDVLCVVDVASGTAYCKPKPMSSGALFKCQNQVLPCDQHGRGVFDPPCNPPTPAEGFAHGQSP